jgi:hypothetical protein
MRTFLDERGLPRASVSTHSETIDHPGLSVDKKTGNLLVRTAATDQVAMTKRTLDSKRGFTCWGLRLSTDFACE